MMKMIFNRIAVIPLAAVALLAAACEESSEVFYATSYPVVRVEASVKLDEAENPENPDPETPENPAAEEEEPAENPLIAEIGADVVANAPVVAGGSYRLEFTRYDGGVLHVVTAPEAAPVTGTFDKTPGAQKIAFAYDGEAYACATTSYRDEEQRSATLLRVDLTKAYQERYPEAGILQVLRLEYTSHRQ